MQYTVKDCILEIKRRNPIGNTKQPVPDELDIMAFLNRVLNTIHNYGVYLNSSVLLKTDILKTDEDGKIETEKQIQKIKEVYLKSDKTSKRLVPFNSLELEYIIEDDTRSVAYSIDGSFVGSIIHIHAAPTKESTVYIRYYPKFEPVIKRDEQLPYSPELFNVLVDYTMALMTGSNKSVDDIDMIPKQWVGVISQYFRNIDGVDGIVAEGPW